MTLLTELFIDGVLALFIVVGITASIVLIAHALTGKDDRAD